ncbi:hypothetical protein ALC60_09326 [Trachymyrmex zeteki]|uniref:Uncharacterized protein n=1 Tax=Mycetomoellerius zeteki TaxID=64791 RepID=A0A151WUH5_9HYME|nr:hypothetical protein ALC60_09326 [Trachymyrmex zeteki]
MANCGRPGWLASQPFPDVGLASHQLQTRMKSRYRASELPSVTQHQTTNQTPCGALCSYAECISMSHSSQTIIKSDIRKEDVAQQRAYSSWFNSPGRKRGFVAIIEQDTIGNERCLVETTTTAKSRLKLAQAYALTPLIREKDESKSIDRFLSLRAEPFVDRQSVPITLTALPKQTRDATNRLRFVHFHLNRRRGYVSFPVIGFLHQKNDFTQYLKIYLDISDR